MVASTQPSTPQRPPDYRAAAERFGYRYTRIESASGEGEPGDDCVLSAGLLDVEELQPGLLITRSDVMQVHDANAEAEMMPGLMVGVALSAPTEAWLDGAGLVSLQPGHAVTLGIGRPVGLRGCYQPGVRRRMLSVFARPEWLVTHGLETMSAVDGSAGVLLNQWTPSPHVRGMIEELMQTGGDGPLGRLRQEALALALLAEAMRHVVPVPAFNGDLRPAERVRMLRVRDRLIAAPEAEYTLARLARDAGVSASVLKDQFQRAFGQSVFGFLRDLRLEQARRGLLDEGWTVAQAAYHAGYRHPTNFATAFRRRFGTPPGALRR